MYFPSNDMADVPALNEQYFLKMAHGDVPGFLKMAEDYFSDTRHLLSRWPEMVRTGEFSKLRDELHRCKGGASMFGCERLVTLLSNRETPEKLEQLGFEFDQFADELGKCELALAAFSQSYA